MKTELRVDPDGVVITVSMSHDEYARGIEAEPLPGIVQGLEHSGDDFLMRLARIEKFLKS